MASGDRPRGRPDDAGDGTRPGHDGDPAAAPAPTRRTVTYCVIPAALADELHDSLRRHFRDDPSIQVIVERRASSRRRDTDRRETESSAPPSADRRRVMAATGRWIAERRARRRALATPPLLPRRARRHAAEITFFERLEPSDEHLEDLDTARLVVRFQAGDPEVFTTIYARYFDRVYAYLRVILRDHHEAEDTTQEVFTKVFESLPRYERRSQPFRAWLFIAARNTAVDRIRRWGRTEAMEPEQIQIEAEAHDYPDPEPELERLGWITDPDLLLFIERLPVDQRRVLALRYMLGLSGKETAEVLDRSYSDVRVLQSRALRFLRTRLAAVGKRSAGRRERAGTQRRFRQAPVLRMRRFALGYGAAPRSRTGR